MKKPRIEEHIVKQRNFSGTAATFLAIGGSALLALKGWSYFPMVTVASLPFLIDAFSLNSLSKKPWEAKSLLHFCDPTFKTRMGGWIKNYINQTDDLIEKKYRTLFLHAWFDQRKMPMKELVSSDFNEFQKLFDELKNKKLTNLPLFISPDSLFITDIVKFLNEDKNDSEKFAKIKKVYEEYAVEGSLGKSFVENNQFAAHSLLNNHKLTTKDYEVIEQYNPSSDNKLALYEDTIEEIMLNILDKENNIKHLKILDNHCNKVLNQKNASTIGREEIINMQKAITSKIQYLELNTELQSKDDVTKKFNGMKI